MKIEKFVYGFVVLMVAFGVSACGRNPLLGKWEVVQPKDLSLPLASTLIGRIEFRKDALVSNGVVIKCKYTVDGDRVTVSVESGPGPGEVYEIDGRRRMYRDIPSIGKVAYDKIN